MIESRPPLLSSVYLFQQSLSPMKFTTLLFLALIPAISAAENFLINSNKLFDFAETSYPEFFSPAGVETTTLDEYLVRYYPNTDTYIGTKGEEVYVYGQNYELR